MAREETLRLETYLLVGREPDPLLADARAADPAGHGIDKGLRRREKVNNLLGRHMLAVVFRGFVRHGQEAVVPGAQAALREADTDGEHGRGGQLAALRPVDCVLRQVPLVQRVC